MASCASRPPLSRGATGRSRKVSKAKLRAEQETTFFAGEEALLEVAKDDGEWNWTLVGPDPEELTLSGGGSLGIDEMRDALANHAHSFGLLRMSFGVEPERVTKWCFVHAVDDANAGNFSRAERGQASAMEPQMERAIRAYVPFTTKIDIRSAEDCNVDSVIEKLRSVVVGADAKLLTKEHLQAAVQDNLERHPSAQENVLKRVKQLDTATEQRVAPRAQAAAPKREPRPAKESSGLQRQRTKVKLFAKGEVVEVYSTVHKKWFLDAEVVDVVRETCELDGCLVVAGSTKVAYDNGSCFTWVALHEIEELIRESPRPKLPHPMTGCLQKQQHFFFMSRWREMYVELHKGFLQWWLTEDDAKKGMSAQKSVYLLGLRVDEVQELFKIRTESTGGAVFDFRATTTQECANWVEALWMHADYCEEVADFYESQLGGTMVRKELMDVMMRRELMSVLGSKANTMKTEMAGVKGGA